MAISITYKKALHKCSQCIEKGTESFELGLMIELCLFSIISRNEGSLSAFQKILFDLGS